MRPLFASLGVLALAACAPQIPVLSVSLDGDPEQRARPASEIVEGAPVTPRFGTGAITITGQEKAWFADGCTFDVALDDQLVAGLRPGEKVTLFAEPGRRVLSFSVRDQEGCTVASTRLALEITEHTTQKVHLISDAHTDLRVEVEPFGRALPR